MKATTLSAGALAPAADYSRGAAGALTGSLGRLLSLWRESSVARRRRGELASLDAHVLRDIGIGEDEITRIHAGEDFVPRHWQA